MSNRLTISQGIAIENGVAEVHCKWCNDLVGKFDFPASTDIFFVENQDGNDKKKELFFDELKTAILKNLPEHVKAYGLCSYCSKK